MSKAITIDFETSSQLDLKKVGSWAYSLHPSTKVLCVGWEDGLVEGQWRDGEDPPEELFKLVSEGAIIKAHNSFFEYAIWRNVCERKMEWPAVADDRWRCTAAQAAACSISRDLGKAGEMLGLAEVKDKLGKKDMQNLAKGKKLNDEATWQSMLLYNRQDVRAEAALSDALPELSPMEQRVWEMSERMNRRGIPADRSGIEAALDVIGRHTSILTREFQTITGIEKPTQREKFILWLNENGVQTDTTAAAVMDEWLEMGKHTADLPQDTLRAIEILRSIGRSSTAKYAKMLGSMDADDRIRGCFLYHGAGTGRWAGRLIQPQNFPKGKIKNMDEAWKLIMMRSLDVFDVIEQDPMVWCSWALRGAILAPEGREFLVSDYSSIEARVTAWLAGQQTLLKLFHENGDVYIAMAEMIYNRKLNKKDNPMERQLGKEAILGLGFGMGYIKFLARVRSYNIEFERTQICSVIPSALRIELGKEIRQDWDRVLAVIPDADMNRDLLDLVFTKFIVNKYRQAYPEIQYMWNCYENMAKAAVRNPGQLYKTHMTAWKFNGRFLMCKLPSGRIMRYFDPYIGSSGALHYTAAKGDTGVFFTDTTYGGKITENVVQAVARDVMAHAMLRLEENPPYHEIVMTVHDELVAEINKGVGNLNEYEKLITVVPSWASGMPIGAESWRGQRYKK